MQAPQVDYAALVVFATNTLVIVLGWIVVHLLSARRDREKVRGEMLVKSADNICLQMSELLLLARSYHTTDRSVEAEQRIKMTIQDAAQSVVGLRAIAKSQENVKKCLKAVREVRESITGMHFEDEHVGPVADNDQVLERMASAVMRAKLCLTNLKHGQFA